MVDWQSSRQVPVHLGRQHVHRATIVMAFRLIQQMITVIHHLTAFVVTATGGENQVFYFGNIANVIKVLVECGHLSGTRPTAVEKVTLVTEL